MGAYEVLYSITKITMTTTTTTTASVTTTASTSAVASAATTTTTTCIPDAAATTTTTPADRLVGLVVKASASGAKDPRFESPLRRDFCGVESYQWLKNWHSSGYPARRLGL